MERGTGTALKNPLYKVAGKTGTAQIAMNNKGYGQETKNIKYKGSFVGYFPADHPEVLNDCGRSTILPKENIMAVR